MDDDKTASSMANIRVSASTKTKYAKPWRALTSYEELIEHLALRPDIIERDDTLAPYDHICGFLHANLCHHDDIARIFINERAAHWTRVYNEEGLSMKALACVICEGIPRISINFHI